LAAASTAAMSFAVINPADTTPSMIGFQTIDSSGRTIGISQNGYSYSATPGQLASTAKRSQSEMDSDLSLEINLDFKNKIPSNGKLQLLIPAEMANITNTLTPYCKTGITNFSCSLKPSIVSS
jgi:hypothetical protein